MSNLARVKLNDGNTIPLIGLGTWQSHAQEVEHAVEHAIRDVGYRHIDCAWAYGNEAEVGLGLKKSGVPRDDVFITSKVWGTFHQDVSAGLQETLDNLGLDYLDLYLIHWPVALNPKGTLYKKGDSRKMLPMRKVGSKMDPSQTDEVADTEWSDGSHTPASYFERDVLEWKIENVVDTWNQMVALQQAGKVKSIGVSNFSKKMLQEFLPRVDVVPAVNQLELHLYNPDHELLAFLRSHQIVAEAYSPLGSTGAPLLEDKVVTEMAQKYALQPADICLGWLAAKDIVILPKSVTPSRVKANFDGTEKAITLLTQSDIQALDSIAAGGKQKRLVNPPWGKKTPS